MSKGKRNEYLPPAKVTMTPEGMIARVQELEKLREEAHFEAVFHAFSDEDSCRIAVEWREELDEGLQAWGEVLAKRKPASRTPARKTRNSLTDDGLAWAIRWWNRAVRKARAACGRAEAALKKCFRR